MKATVVASSIKTTMPVGKMQLMEEADLKPLPYGELEELEMKSPQQGIAAEFLDQIRTAHSKDVFRLSDMVSYQAVLPDLALGGAYSGDTLKMVQAMAAFDASAAGSLSEQEKRMFDPSYLQLMPDARAA